jgi:hypothetical protein
MMRFAFVGCLLFSGLWLGGCQSATADAVLVLARREADRQTYFVREAAGVRAWTELGLPATTGNLLLAPAGGAALATIGAAGSGPAELRLLRPGTAVAPTVLAKEWVWDAALRADGAAAAWIEGNAPRRLRTAQAPEWRPVDFTLPAGAEPAAPRWLPGGGLLVVLREPGGSRLVVLAADGAVTATWHRVAGGTRLAEPVAAAENVFVLEVPADGSPRRLLRLAAAGAAPTVLAVGYFAEGTLQASPDGKYLAAVWSESLAAVQRGEAGLRWIGQAWSGLPAELSRVAGFAWSPDGRRLAVARRADGREWVEVHPGGAANETPGSAPQWWSVRP